MWKVLLVLVISAALSVGCGGAVPPPSDQREAVEEPTQPAVDDTTVEEPTQPAEEDTAPETMPSAEEPAGEEAGTATHSGSEEDDLLGPGLPPPRPPASDEEDLSL